MLELDCRKCSNLGEDGCRKYGADPDKAVKACAADGFRHYHKKPAGYEGKCPLCGSGDGTIIEGPDGRFRNICRVRGCPLWYKPAPAVGFDTADDCRNPFETEYLKHGTVTVGEYMTGKKEEPEA